jgi:hypothetical protein
VGHG